MTGFEFEAAKWQQDGEGTWLCLLVKEPTSFLRQFIADLSGKRKYVAEIKEWRKKRSGDANSYAWALMGKLAEHYRVTPISVYRSEIVNISDAYEVVCVQETAKDRFRRIWGKQGLGWVCEEFPSKLPGCVNLRCFYGSSVYDTGQMSRLIDGIVQECQAAGIETATPEELSRLKEEWT